MPQNTPRPVDTRVPRARALRRDAEAEKKLWQHLRQPPFKEHNFQRQATIGRYFADFASHRLRIVIEVDGGQHLDNPEDDQRTSFLVSAGYRVLRFWNNEVLANIAGVLLTIDAAVNADRLSTPDLESELRSPRTPPQAGGRE